MHPSWLRYSLLMVPVLLVLACERPLPRRTEPLSRTPTVRPPPVLAQAVPEVAPLSGEFPKPLALEPQVAFWRNVYAVWHRSQVVVHDDRYLDVIYEVIDLPGEMTENYTSSQQAWVQERLDFWQDRLRQLEQKLATGTSLNADDQQLASQIGQGTEIRTAIRGASERVRAQRGLRERFRRGLEISGRYDRVFRDLFRQVGLPEELAYLPLVESSFQTQARSSAGAVGLWQFTRAAAQIFMPGQAGIDNRLDPITSARGAARYLSHAYDQLGSWPLALTAYNHGISGMQRAKDDLGPDFMRIVNEYDHPQFGFASRNYYAEFLAACEVASQPERFFPEGVRYETSLEWHRAELAERLSDSPASRHYGAEKRRGIAMKAARTDPVKTHKALGPAGLKVRLASPTSHRLTLELKAARFSERGGRDRNASHRIQIYRSTNPAVVEIRPRISHVSSKPKSPRAHLAWRK